MKKRYNLLMPVMFFILLFLFLYTVLAIFFDEAIFLRKDTFYKGKVSDKVVALTFDDGPSPVWTPKILDELKRAGIKATFFMVGEHVREYPDVARRIVSEGHDIGNHTYDHHVLLYYKMEEIERELGDAAKAIKEVTGKDTAYFRPPKAWLNAAEKSKIISLGYRIILWTLNSKDWVTFDDQYIVRYIVQRARPGDIILMHDSGGFFATEGGDRHETVAVIFRLVEKMKERGYRFVTISELLEMERDNIDAL